MSPSALLVAAHLFAVLWTLILAYGVNWARRAPPTKKS